MPDIPLTDPELIALAHLNPDIPAHRHALQDIRVTLLVALRMEMHQGDRSARP